MIKEYLAIAIKNLRTRQLRSWLTILGIVIGVFLIITLISLSQGLRNAVMKELKMMGEDLVFVFPGQINNIMTSFAGGLELTEDDVRTIKKIEGVDTVVPIVYKAEVMRFQNESKPLMISGLDWKEALPVMQADLGWSLKEGQWPESGKKELLIGSLVATDIFPDIRVGSLATIKGRQFEIVGIMKSLGNKQDDSLVFTDMSIFQDITGEKDNIKSVMVKIASGFTAEEVGEEIKEQLNKTRKKRTGETEQSFSVITSEKATGMVANILGVLQAVILGFASIAIIVGGIGIMNTMFTSVRERTKEIGILKAIGAENKMITLIFLLEAGIIGLIGGVGGVALGFGFAKLVEVVVKLNVFYLKASLSPLLIIFGLVFSISIGCLSGLFPARKAARLKPVDALRNYE
ncbi:MAG: ABC transporter permease [bacterium]